MSLKWEICSDCNGEGKSSAYLGAYSADEFDEAFDDEQAEDYFAGRYDRKCETCNGSGKVKAPTCDRRNACEDCAAVYDQYHYEALVRSELEVGA